MIPLASNKNYKLTRAATLLQYFSLQHVVHDLQSQAVLWCWHKLILDHTSNYTMMGPDRGQ